MCMCKQFPIDTNILILYTYHTLEDCKKKKRKEKVDIFHQCFEWGASFNSQISCLSKCPGFACILHNIYYTIYTHRAKDLV